MSSSQLAIGRWSCVGHVYSVTAVVAGRRPAFEDPGNADIVVDGIRAAERAGRSRTMAWVVMPDHLHWLLELRAGVLADCIGQLKSRSGRLVNRRMGGHGSLWQAGYFDHALRREESLVRHARYIAANPVRAGLSQQVGEYPFAWCRWPEG